jgi:hypothetical protein
MRNYFFKYFIIYKKEKFFEFLKIKYKILNIYYFNLKKFKLINKKKIFCIESGKKKSVDFFFLLYRMDLKNHFSLGFLNGLKKLS